VEENYSNLTESLSVSSVLVEVASLPKNAAMAPIPISPKSFAIPISCVITAETITTPTTHIPTACIVPLSILTASQRTYIN